MRELKFRAFSKKDNRMYHGRDVELWNVGNDVSCRVFLRRSEERHFSEYDVDAIPLQYTELKDKKELDVYEGDIVAICVSKNSFNGFPVWHKGSVIYKSGAFCVRNKFLGNEIDYPLISYTANSLSTLEVLGNIYENPELLS